MISVMNVACTNSLARRNRRLFGNRHDGILHRHTSEGMKIGPMIVTAFKPSDVIGALQIVVPPTYNNHMHISGRVLTSHWLITAHSQCLCVGVTR